MKLILLALILFSQHSLADSCENLHDFDVITREVTAKFYDQKFKGLDWPQRVSFYRAQIKCAGDTDHVAHVVNSLLSELKTSHTGVYTKNDIEYWGLKSIFSGDLKQFAIPFPGIWPYDSGEKTFARFVLPGSTADKAGLLSGDRLISLDGNKFLPLSFNIAKSSVLEVSRNGKKNQKIVLQAEAISIQEAFLTATQKSQKVIVSGKDKIGYFHLWCGTHPEFLEALKKSLNEFKQQKVSKLIIDLRDGFGGANPEYLDPVIKDSYYNNVPKTFLINEGVRSGKEWLAAIIKRDKIGTLIGTKTAGAFIAGGPVDIGTDKYFLYLAMKEFNPPDIPILEGVGVQPDVLVNECREFCAGFDPVLDRALHN